jgi:hypothetical protein
MAAAVKAAATLKVQSSNSEKVIFVLKREKPVCQKRYGRYGTWPNGVPL